MSRWLALGLGLLSTAVAAAQVGQKSPEVVWYQVEVIIFENEDPTNISSESWPDDPGAPLTGNAVELIPWELRDQVTAPLDWLQPPAAEPPPGAEPVADAAASETERPESIPVTDNVGLRPFVLLPDNERKLGDLARRLTQSRQHHVLLHAAWRQPLLKSRDSLPVHVHSTTGSAEAYAQYQQRSASGAVPAVPVAPDAEPASPAADIPPGPPQPSAAEPEPLDGVLTVSLSRYLHLDVDLLFRKLIPVAAPTAATAQPGEETGNDLIVIGKAPTGGPPATAAEAVAPQATPTTKLQAFHLVQSRRMRSNELHYLDHPMLGVLAQITPVTAAQ